MSTNEEQNKDRQSTTSKTKSRRIEGRCRIFLRRKKRSMTTGLLQWDLENHLVIPHFLLRKKKQHRRSIGGDFVFPMVPCHSLLLVRQSGMIVDSPRFRGPQDDFVFFMVLRHRLLLVRQSVMMVDSPRFQGPPDVFVLSMVHRHNFLLVRQSVRILDAP